MARRRRRRAGARASPHEHGIDLRGGGPEAGAGLTMRPLDLICIGRAAVDLYGEQIGGRLEDMRSFAKYLGGSPANTAVGASRLGLRAAMLTRVGDEHNGRFVRE